jgi:hypothetical protein
LEPRDIDILAETEDFSVWRMQDPDGEMIYHVEFGPLTVHLFPEEWDQFVALVRQLPEGESGLA